MTYKEAIEYLQPVADNTPLTGYGAALTAAIYALHMMDEGAVPVVRCKDCKHYGGVTFGNVCRRWSAPLAGMKNCTNCDY